MKKLIAILIILSAPLLALRAETTPEEMIILYFEAFKKGDVKTLAANMHEGELAKFKEAILPVIEKNLEMDPTGASRDAAAILQFVGRDDIETVRAEAPRDFFSRFMRWMIRLNPNMIKSLAGATIQPLGFIPENDMAHVTYRIKVNVMGASVTQLKIMSVKKEHDAWRLMMPGEIEGLGKML